MTELESAKLVKIQNGYCTGIRCDDCFAKPRCGFSVSGIVQRLQAAKNYIAQHEKTYPREMMVNDGPITETYKGYKRTVIGEVQARNGATVYVAYSDINHSDCHCWNYAKELDLPKEELSNEERLKKLELEIETLKNKLKN